MSWRKRKTFKEIKQIALLEKPNITDGELLRILEEEVAEGNLEREIVYDLRIRKIPYDNAQLGYLWDQNYRSSFFIDDEKITYSVIAKVVVEAVTRIKWPNCNDIISYLDDVGAKPDNPNKVLRMLLSRKVRFGSFKKFYVYSVTGINDLVAVSSSSETESD